MCVPLFSDSHPTRVCVCVNARRVPAAHHSKGRRPSLARGARLHSQREEREKDLCVYRERDELTGPVAQHTDTHDLSDTRPLSVKTCWSSIVGDNTRWGEQQQAEAEAISFALAQDRGNKNWAGSWCTMQMRMDDEAP